MTRDRFIAIAAEAIVDEYGGDVSNAAAQRYAVLALDAVGAWETIVEAVLLLRTETCSDPDCCKRANDHAAAMDRLRAVVAAVESRA